MWPSAGSHLVQLTRGLARTFRRAGAIPEGFAALVLIGSMLTACSSDVDVIAVSMSADGMTLYVQLDICNGDASVEVEETAGEVVLRASSDEVSAFGGGDDCADEVAVVLDQPLGNRRLVDPDGRDVAIQTMP